MSILGSGPGLAGLIECSAGWLRVPFRFCPAICHWPDRDPSDWPCALSVETCKRPMLNAATGSDTLQLFMVIYIVLLEFGFCHYVACYCYEQMSCQGRGGL